MAEEKAIWRAELATIGQDRVLWPLVLLATVSAVISFLSLRALGTLVPVCLVLALVFYGIRTRSFPMPSFGLWVVFGGFVLLVGFSAAMSLDVEYALGRFVKLALYALMAILLWSLSQRLSTLGALQSGLLVSFILGLCWALFEGLSEGALFGLLRELPPGEASFSSNRPVVILALTAWPAALIVAQRYGFLAALALLVALFAASLSGESQAAQVGLAGATVILVVAFWLPRAALWVAGVGGVVAILAAPFVFSQPDLMEYAEKLPTAYSTILPRMAIWVFVSEKIMMQPLLGYGLEAGRFLPTTDMVQIYFSGDFIHHPHNGILQVWLEMGVLGALAMATVWGLLLQQVSKLSEESLPFVLAGVCCALFIGAVAHGVWQSWWVCALALLPFLFKIALTRAVE